MLNQIYYYLFPPGNTDFNAEDILIILQERQISKDSIEVDCPTSEKSIVKDSGWSFQDLTLGYMTKTLNQIIFSPSRINPS
jgi:hypothetical protein